MKKQRSGAPSVRRQWGGDRREQPLPPVAIPISDRRIAMGRVAVVTTVVGWALYFWTWLSGEFIQGQAWNSRYKVEAVFYLLVVTALTCSAIAYLVSRLGFFYRSRAHRRVPRAGLDEFFDSTTPSLTVIVPSYQEDARVVRNTLLSAALQEYPGLEVVLLIDDPPQPKSKRHRKLLREARALPGQIEAMLAEPAGHFAAALERFESSMPEGSEATVADMAVLSSHFEQAVHWLNELANGQEIVDHADTFFADQVVRGLAADLAVGAAAIRAAAREGSVLPRERIVQLYRRLVWTFQAKLSSFERKLYGSLSHDANKAMNLNSFIGLMGNSYRDAVTVAGRVLIPADPDVADLQVPDPDYVLTLDADSVLLPEYCLRLVYLMEQSEHARVGVAQTPYSAYPGSATRLERIAGATTDLQHIVHQGLTHYDATFWVGANAVLRKRALDEVMETGYAGNWEIRRYIQDRTVIEDTESTIDLGTRGWQLLNYPERLSYSSTPPDFGSLCIQRRRWANGGLLILPKLRRQSKARRARGERTRFGELFLRTNYMASICWSTISLLLLLAYPFRNQLVSPLLGLVALPYFIAMASDLKYCGYKRLDVLRVYGFNLMLLPVNLAGVGNSIVQALTGDKSVFGRTPKVRDRTVPGLLFVVAPYVLVGLAVFTVLRDYEGSRWDNAVYAGLNAVLASYAIMAFIGVRHSIVDMCVQVKARLYKPERPRAQAHVDPASVVANPAVVDWAAALHFGRLDHSYRTPSMPVTPVASLGPATAMPQRLTLDVEALPDEVPAEVTAPAEPAPPPVGAAVDGASPTPAPDQYPRLAFRTVFQPVVDLATRETVGCEALTRFEDGVAPAWRIADAAERGVGIELEATLALAAVVTARALPAGVWLSLNASVEFARSGVALRKVVEASPNPIVVELGESDDLDDEDSPLRRALAELPGEVGTAIGCARPSYDSLRHVQELRPRFVKLQRAWVAGVDGDPARRALVGAMVAIVREYGGTVIAEGIESDGELAALLDAGVRLGQGYLLGRPGGLTTDADLAPSLDSISA